MDTNKSSSNSDGSRAHQRDLLNKSSDFLKIENTPSSKLFVTGLASYDGERWAAKHRKILNPAFNMEKLKHMLLAFSTCCDELIKKWEKLVATTGSSELDVSPEFETLTENVISQAAFGSSHEKGYRVLQLQVEQAQLFIQEIHGKKLITLKANPRRMEIYKEVQTILKGIIEKKERAMKMGDTINDDLLGMMIESNHNESIDNGSLKKTLSIDDVIEECKLFYFAGQETTSKVADMDNDCTKYAFRFAGKSKGRGFTNRRKNKPKFDDLQHL